MALLIRAALLAAAVLLPAAVRPVQASMAQQAVTEAQAKAGFLYNCAMFVSWPSAAAKGDLVVGVIGDEHVSAVVKDMQGRKVDGRTLRVVPVRPNDALHAYHILFIAGEDSGAAREVLERIGTAPVLTVGEAEDFTADGGVVRLFTDQGRLRFEINMTRVERTGLKVSAKMLGLARIVR